MEKTERRALEGLKVASFCWHTAGPQMQRSFADFGATVVKVESSRHHPDQLRTGIPYRGGVKGINRSVFFANYNSGVYSITLNLKSQKGIETARRLMLWSDVVLENFSPGTLEKWGLGYDTISQAKPDIIMLRLSNQGQTGPLSRHPAVGPQMAAQCGINAITGWPDRLPSVFFIAYCDFIAPRMAVAALMAALSYRQRTGRGQCLDVSQYETAVYSVAPLFAEYCMISQPRVRMANRCPGAAPHGIYRCLGNDRWCAVSVFNQEQWEALCRIFDNPTWCLDSRFATLPGRKENEDELDKLLCSATVGFSPDALMRLLQENGLPAGAVNNSEGITNDPQLQHREAIWHMEHPVIGDTTYYTEPFRLSRSPSERRMPAPRLGEHTEYICNQVLGMSTEEFVKLVGEGAFE